eukprot:8603157-Alexandrium_andersonii.AAC.1
MGRPLARWRGGRTVQSRVGGSSRHGRCRGGHAWGRRDERSWRDLRTDRFPAVVLGTMWVGVGAPA